MKKIITSIISFVIVMALIFPASAIATVALKSIKLDKTNVTLTIGQTFSLKATLSPANTTQKRMNYVTANKNIATIDATGKITGVSAGTTTITVGGVNSKVSAKCKVTVVKPEPVKLTWWTFQNHDMEYMKAMIAKFSQENKEGIEIEYVIQTSNNFRQALDLAFQSNQAPDIFTGQDLAKDYKPKGYAEPLTKWITNEIKQRYGNMLYREGENGVDGVIYSLANTGITYRLMYNKDLFKKAGIEEPPKTIYEMIGYAKIIADMGKADKIYGFAINMKNTQTSMARSVEVIGQLSGFKTYDYKTGLYDFRPYKPILDAFRRMVADGSMFPGIESLDVDPMRTQFAQGKIGMYLSGAWEPAWYANQKPPTTVDFAAAPTPTIDGKIKGPADITGIRWLYISSKTQYKEQAWSVLKHFYTDEIQMGYHEKGYGIVVVPTVIQKAKKSEMKGMDGFLPTKYDAFLPPCPSEKSLQIEGKPYNDIFAGVIMGAVDFDKEIGGLNKKYNDALQAAIKDGKQKDLKIANYNPANLIGK